MRHLLTSLTLALAVLLPASWSTLNAEALKIKNLRSVYDGDTFRVDLEGNYPAVFGENLSIRVHGLDTPEIRGSSDLEKAAAKKVRDYVRDTLTNANNVTLINEDRDKYFRVLANVIIDEETDLTDLLIEMHYAKPYHGGTKSDWTDDELYYILVNPS